MFHLKAFSIQQDQAAQRVGTDALVLGVWPFHYPQSPLRRVLDVGTGTGILALLQAQRHPEALIEAWELEESAAREAQANFLSSPFTARLSLHHTSFLDRARELVGSSSTFAPFDLIISNPPFFPEEVVSSDRARRLARHSEAEGLSPETLLAYAPSLLSPHGALALITPAYTLPSLRQCAVESLLRLVELVYVYSVPGRLVRVLTLWCRLRVGEDYIPTYTEHLTLLGKDGASTPAYRALMQPYLLPEYL